MNGTPGTPGMNLSVCLIYRDEDAHWLEACQESLPPGIELCAVRTVESTGRTAQFRLIKDEAGPGGTWVRQAQWVYPRNGFRFDTARNKCLALAQRAWVLALDADERLLPHQYRDWIQATETAPPTTGGLYVGVAGSIPYGGSSHGGSHTNWQRHNGSQVRLFRNNPGFHFRKRVHEFFGLEESIRENGFDVIESTLAIHHVGYEVSPEQLHAKCARNIRLSVQELASRFEQPDIQTKMYDTLRLQSQLPLQRG